MDISVEEESVCRWLREPKREYGKCQVFRRAGKLNSLTSRMSYTLGIQATENQLRGIYTLIINRKLFLNWLHLIDLNTKLIFVT